MTSSRESSIITTIHGHTVSTDKENVLAMEIYPPNINQLCSQFSMKWAFDGLCHPKTHSYRQGVIVCNMSQHTIYFENYLDCCVHARVLAGLANEYVNELLCQEGYELHSSSTFDATKKNLLMVGSDESTSVQNCFAVINDGTRDFDDDVKKLFKQCNLSSLQHSLLSSDNLDEVKSHTSCTSRGQPSIINMSYAQQNSTDHSYIPGLSLPKLITSNIKLIEQYGSENPLMWHILEMMTETINFYKKNYSMLDLHEPFLDDHCNEVCGNHICKEINHPKIEYTKMDCFEGCNTGYKTEENNGFDSHIDILNS